MKQQFKIIQKQKQQFSSKLVPSMELLKLSQQDLESLVDASLIDNPFSEVDQSNISLELRDIDIDHKTIKKSHDEVIDYDIADENKNDLIEYVMPQLSPYIKSKKDEEIFMALLESLDSKGYLVGTIEELRKILNIKEYDLIRHLDILKHVEPVGLGSENFRECLLIQLSEKQNSELAKKIIESHLEAISLGNFSKIAKLENTSVDQVKEALTLIQSLNPIPANGFKVNTKTIYIIPDVYISVNEDEILIDLNSRINDKLKLNQSNYDLYKNNKFDKESKELLKKKLNDFKWLQYSTQRRGITIKKIITFLVNYQIEYFRTGQERYLKPVRLIDVANETELHYSTISRAVSNKYFQCSYGTYPFRFLMPKCYEKKGDTVASINTIKNEIKEMIKFEDKEHPLSDEQIHSLLEEEGFSVSRRSVTLYRKECYIPSSRNRKISHEKKKG